MSSPSPDIVDHHTDVWLDFFSRTGMDDYHARSNRGKVAGRGLHLTTTNESGPGGANKLSDFSKGTNGRGTKIYSDASVRNKMNKTLGGDNGNGSGSSTCANFCIEEAKSRNIRRIGLMNQLTSGANTEGLTKINSGASQSNKHSTSSWSLLVQNQQQQAQQLRYNSRYCPIQVRNRLKPGGTLSNKLKKKLQINEIGEKANTNATVAPKIQKEDKDSDCDVSMKDSENDATVGTKSQKTDIKVKPKPKVLVSDDPLLSQLFSETKENSSNQSQCQSGKQKDDLFHKLNRVQSTRQLERKAEKPRLQTKETRGKERLPKVRYAQFNSLHEEWCKYIANTVNTIDSSTVLVGCKVFKLVSTTSKTKSLNEAKTTDTSNFNPLVFIGPESDSNVSEAILVKETLQMLEFACSDGRMRRYPKAVVELHVKVNEKIFRLRRS